MPFKTFTNWLFDGKINSPIPNPDPENGIPDILKYNSPITSTYIISLFTKCQKLNYYLNKYLNNMSLRYIDKSELFFYIKKCVIENKIKRHQIHYFIYDRKNKLFQELRKKLPHLKNGDISLMCEQIEKSNEKESIYQSLGIKKPKKEKIKKIKIKKIQKKLSLIDFLRDNFSVHTIV